MSHMHSFIPEGVTSLINASSSPSAGVQISTGNVAGVRFMNTGVVPIYIAMGSSGVSATQPTTSAAATGIPLMAGSIETFDVRPGFWLSAVTSAGNALLYATPGSGL